MWFYSVFCWFSVRKWWWKRCFPVACHVVWQEVQFGLLRRRFGSIWLQWIADCRRDFFRMMNKKETAAKMSRSTASPPVLQGSRTDLLILAAVCTSGGGYSRRERFSAYQTRMLVSKMMFDRNLPSAGPNHNPTEHRSQGTFEGWPIIVSGWSVTSSRNLGLSSSLPQRLWHEMLVFDQK